MKRSEVVRRRKIRKFWGDQKNCEAHSKRMALIMGTPERRKAQSERWTRLMVDPKRREAMSKSTKRVMRNPERRKTQSENMKRLRANPEFQARRLAGFRKAEATTERKARRRTTLAKTMAVPAIRRRRIRNCKRASSTPEYRTKMSTNKTKFWAGLRARLAGQAGTAKARNRRGRPSKEETYSEAANLQELGWTWRNIARKLDPDFAKDPDAAKERMRLGVLRWKRSIKQRTLHDEPKTLLND